MIYKSFQDMKLSALGMGCMRLPVLDGKNDRIDVAQVEKMVALAMEKGVNYYDTAYGYHDGNSEGVIGAALRKYPRDSYYIASKFPGYDLRNMDKIEAVFEEQFRRTGMDYFDFYLFHNVCEANIDAYLDEERYNLHDFLMKQKAAGKIRHLGFSVHGRQDVLERFLNAYGKDMEFCQIQLNWIDWDFQDARAKVELLNKWNIPIWVMEPLRGGKLAKLSPENEEKLLTLRPEETVPGWSFRYIQSVPGVTVTLSGMSDYAQMQANLETFETEQPLNPAEVEALYEMARSMTGGVPCTACRYCTTHCPQELDIPRLLNLYNEHVFTGGGFLAPMNLSTIPADKQPSSCIGCRSCEAVCPQNIKISEALADFVTKL